MECKSHYYSTLCGRAMVNLFLISFFSEIFRSGVFKWRKLLRYEWWIPLKIIIQLTLVFIHPHILCMRSGITEIYGIAYFSVLQVKTSRKFHPNFVFIRFFKSNHLNLRTTRLKSRIWSENNLKFIFERETLGKVDVVSNKMFRV